MAQHDIPDPLSRDFAYRTPTVLDDRASEITHVHETPIHRTPTIEEVVNLPLRTLSNDANLDEYTQETVDGRMLREVRSIAGKIERYELVTFTIDDD